MRSRRGVSTTTDRRACGWRAPGRSAKPKFSGANPMAGKFHHEALYRGDDLLTKLSALRITLCGAGAIGSNLADNLVRQGLTRLRAIDHDRVEEHNVSTQLYGEADVGLWKVEALRNHLFSAAGVEID